MIPATPKHCSTQFSNEEQRTIRTPDEIQNAAAKKPARTPKSPKVLVGVRDNAPDVVVFSYGRSHELK